MKFLSPDTGDGGAAPAVDTGDNVGDVSLIAPPETPAVAATPPAPTGNGAPAGDEDYVQTWADKLPEDLRKESSLRVLKAKNAEELNNELAKGYVHAQKAIGRKGVFVPTDKSPPEEVAEFRKAMGAPDTIEGYQVKPDTIPEGLDWNDDLAKPFLQIAHKYHASQAMMKELVAAHTKVEEFRMQSTLQQAEEKAIEKEKKGTSELQALWKGDFNQNVLAAQQAAAHVGVSKDDPGFGSPKMVAGFVRLWTELSKYLKEDKLVIGGGAPTTPGGYAAMAHDIMVNKDNPDYQRYQDHDPDIVAKVRFYNMEALKQKK